MAELREEIARWLFCLHNPARYWGTETIDPAPVYAEVDEIMPTIQAAIDEARADELDAAAIRLERDAALKLTVLPACRALAAAARTLHQRAAALRGTARG